MGKKSIICLLATVIFIFAGCSPKEEKIKLLPDKVSHVKMTYQHGEQKTELELEKDKVKDWKKWVQSLDFEHKAFQKGKTPNDSYQGIKYTFDINQGEKKFTYIDDKDDYILLEKEWYVVQNPSAIPVVADVMDNKASFEAVEESEPGADNLATKPGKVSVKGSGGTLSIILPEGFECIVLPEGSENLQAKEYGFRFYPKEEAAGSYVEILNNHTLALCGTGLKTEEVTLAGDTAFLLKYDDNKLWDFITFSGKSDNLSAMAPYGEDWLLKYNEQVMEILDSLKLE